jgi:hypothetical protein
MKIGYIGYSADEVQSIIDNIFAQRDALKAELATTKRALELACIRNKKKELYPCPALTFDDIKCAYDNLSKDRDISPNCVINNWAKTIKCWAEYFINKAKETV